MIEDNLFIVIKGLSMGSGAMLGHTSPQPQPRDKSFCFYSQGQKFLSLQSGTKVSVDFDGDSSDKGLCDPT